MNFIDRKKDATIICPYCGREYLPAEIYFPNQFFGTPEDIDRDAAGKIEVYDGEPMNLVEEYTCDCCGKTFKTSATISFKSAVVESSDFEETYISPIQSSRISLFEGIADNDNN